MRRVPDDDQIAFIPSIFVFAAGVTAKLNSRKSVKNRANAPIGRFATLWPDIRAHKLTVS